MSGLPESTLPTWKQGVALLVLAAALLFVGFTEAGTTSGPPAIAFQVVIIVVTAVLFAFGAGFILAHVLQRWNH